MGGSTGTWTTRFPRKKQTGVMAEPPGPFPDFFEVLKDQLRQPHWNPISHFAVRAVPEGGDWPLEEGMMSMLQDSYRQHG